MTIPVAAWDFERGTLVEVLWIDSTASHEWGTREVHLGADLAASMRIRTAGYLVEDTADHMAVSHSFTGNARIDCTIVIPRFAVVEIHNLVQDGPALQPTLVR
jgi:hypothetical protein